MRYSEAAKFIARAFQEDNCLRVWSFYDAPALLQDLSPHGGDEDWLLLVPPEYDREIWWAKEHGSFGCCSVTKHLLPNGWEVRIGAHS
jgi:hypothetical protein